MSSLVTTSIRVAPCDNRQFLSHGDNNHEQRIFRSPAGDQTSSGRSFGREHLSHPGALTGLVSPLVASLPGAWPQRTVRSYAWECSTQAYRARLGTHDFDRSPTADRADPSGDTLQSHWGQCDSSRTSGLTYSTATWPAHHRTGSAAQWGDTPPRASGALFTSPYLSGTRSARVQSTSSSRRRRSHLSQRSAATVLYFRRQRRLRWRGLPENLPFPQDGSHSRLPGRMLEEPRSPGPRPIRQRPRSRRLGTCRTLSFASHSAVFALRNRVGIDPTGATLPQRARGKLQWLVPATPVPASLFTPGSPQAR